MIPTKRTYLPWFILKEIPGLGNHLIKQLIQRFGSPEYLLGADRQALESTGFLNARVIGSILNSDRYLPAAQKALDLLIRKNAGICSILDSTYPALLLQTDDPPPVITFYGQIDPQACCIAIVGSRKATTYGKTTARKLAFDLAEMGFTIVSGLAVGIDTAAHEGAIEAGGNTIAVLGSGLGVIYPARNRSLFSAITCNGAVMSEFPYQAVPKPSHFPVRNRIIAGLSAGTIVVEAAKRSGSLITARLAAEYGREVFAVPGSIKSGTSAGTHLILKQGATLIENHLDVVDEIGQFARISPATAPGREKEKTDKGPVHVTDTDDPYARAIIGVLEPYPVHIDTIIQTTGLDAGGITASLLELELNGIVQRSQGNYFNISEEKIG